MTWTVFVGCFLEGRQAQQNIFFAGPICLKKPSFQLYQENICIGTSARGGAWLHQNPVRDLAALVVLEELGGCLRLFQKHARRGERGVLLVCFFSLI
jgi:hypothetical protein